MAEPFDSLQQIARNLQVILGQYADLARREVEQNGRMYDPAIIDGVAQQLLIATEALNKLDILAHSEFGGRRPQIQQQSPQPPPRVTLPPGGVAFITASAHPQQPPQVVKIPQQPFTVGKCPLRILPPWDVPTFDPGPVEGRREALQRIPDYKPRHRREGDSD